MLFINWYLLNKELKSVFDGKKSEILSNDWNKNNNTEYSIDYTTAASKGFVLKVLVADDSLIVNLMVRYIFIRKKIIFEIHFYFKIIK